MGTLHRIVRGELFKVTTCADILYVPYKGAALVLTDLKK